MEMTDEEIKKYNVEVLAVVDRLEQGESKVKEVASVEFFPDGRIKAVSFHKASIMGG